MKFNSCSNLLSRAKLKGSLGGLFFEKGKQKNSVQLKSLWVQLGQQALAVRLSIQKQIEEMKLPVYDKFDVL